MSWTLYVMCVKMRQLFVAAGCTSGCKVSPPVHHELEYRWHFEKTYRMHADGLHSRLFGVGKWTSLLLTFDFRVVFPHWRHVPEFSCTVMNLIPLSFPTHSPNGFDEFFRLVTVFSFIWQEMLLPTYFRFSLSSLIVKTKTKRRKNIITCQL